MSTLRGPGVTEVAGPTLARVLMRRRFERRAGQRWRRHGWTDAPIQPSRPGQGVVSAEELFAVVVAEQEREPGEIGA
jgi:hypothetical protein